MLKHTSSCCCANFRHVSSSFAARRILDLRHHYEHFLRFLKDAQSIAGSIIPAVACYSGSLVNKAIGKELDHVEPGNSGQS